MKNNIKRIVAFVCILALTIGSVTISNPVKEVEATENSATTGARPVYLQGFKHVTLENFNIPKEVTYSTEDKYVQLKDNNGTPIVGTLDKVLLSLKVDFTYDSDDRAALMFGGNGWNKGFAFSPNNSGSAVGIINYFHENSPMNDDVQKYQPGVLQAAKVNEALGRTDFSFLEPFTLQVSSEYTTEGADTYLTLVFYINGKQIQVDNRTNGTSGNFGPSLKMKVTNSMTNHGNYIGYRKGDGGTLKLSSVIAENEAMTQFTWSDFVDAATGTTAGDATFQATNQDENVLYQLKGYTSELPSSSFKAKLKFSGKGEENRISYAATQSSEGLNFYVNSEDEFRLDTIGIGRVELALVDNGITFEKEIAGVDSFTNREFEFKITTEFADYDGSGPANDVQLGFYFNGTLYNGQYFYAYDCKDAFGTYLKVHAQTSAITIKSIIQAVYLPGFKNVTLENFNIPKEATYNEDKYVQLKDNNGTPVAGTFNKTLLSLKVDFTYTSGSDRCSPLVIGGSQWESGFGFTPNSSGTAVGIIDWFNTLRPMTDAAVYQPGVLQASKVNEALGRDDFSFHEEFILQVSFEYTTEGEDTYLNLTFYVNGKQIQIDNRMNGTSGNFGSSLKMKVTNSMQYHGNYIGFDTAGQNGTLKLSSVVPENDDLTSITWTDFTSATTGEAAVDHVFEAGSSCIAYRLINENIQKMSDTAFEAKVTFAGEGTGSRIMYAGTQNWYGLFLYALENGDLRLETNASNSPQLGLTDQVFTFQKEIAGGENFTFLNRQFTLKITTEYGDYDGNGVENDVQLGFYFEGKLYNNKYIYGYDCKDAFGNYLNVYANSADITVKSVGSSDESQGPGTTEPGDDQKPETLKPDESFQKLTFSHFNVSDGTYSYVVGEPSLRVLEKTEKSLDKAVFSGDVFLAEGKKLNIRYGGIKSEQGLMFEIRGDGKIHLMWIADSGNEYVLTGINSSKAQTDLFGKWLNLKISTEIIDADNDGQDNDIQLAIWFNDIAYNNSYIIVRDKAHLLGSYFSIACQEEGSSVQVRSIPELVDPVDPEDIVVINKSFKQTTFSHLAIEDGTYAHVAGEASLRVLGRMKTSVDKTVFSGDVLLAEGKKLNIRYGGNAAEQGLMFEVTGKGTINLVWIAKSGNEYIVTGITSTKAKTDLFGDWLNLKISTEIIDADKDGQKNDIRMAIWFNDIAYNERYIIIRDKADLLGSYFSIACQEEGAFVQVRSIPELIEPFDYTLYGLTEDWEETLLNTDMVAKISVGGSKTSASPTGDATAILIPGVALTVSAAGVLWYVLMKRKENREA